MILNALTAIIDAYFIQVFFSGFLSRKENVKPHLISLAVFTAVVFAANTHIPNLWLKLLIFMALYIIYGVLNYNSDFTTTIFVSLLFMSILLVVDFFAFGIASLCAEYGFAEKWIYPIGTLSTYIYYFVIIFVIKKSKLNIFVPEQKSLRILILSMPSICALIMCSFFFYFPMNNELPSLVFVLAGLFFLIMNIAIILFCRISYGAKIKENALTILSTQIGQYESEFNSALKYRETIRKYHHEIRHFKAILEGIVAAGNIEVTKEFAKEISESLPDIDYIDTGNMMMNVILQIMLDKTKREGINVTYDFRIPSKINISNTDLCVVLGNAIENAIEACKVLNKSERKISLTIFQKSTYLFIKVCNTTNNRLNSVNGFPLSTKVTEGFHGQGLRNIQAICEKYNGNLSYECSNQQFVLGCMLENYMQE